jgi:hypothetical protein
MKNVKQKIESKDILKVVAKLGGKDHGDHWMCLCPAHPDKTPSLCISEALDGKMLAHCHADCDQERVVSALKERHCWPSPNRDATPEIVAEVRYAYMNADGSEEALMVVRQNLSDGKKKITQQCRKDGQWVPGGYKGPLQPYRFKKRSSTAKSGL